MINVKKIQDNKKEVLDILKKDGVYQYIDTSLAVAAKRRHQYGDIDPISKFLDDKARLLLSKILVVFGKPNDTLNSICSEIHLFGISEYLESVEV